VVQARLRLQAAVKKGSHSASICASTPPAMQAPDALLHAPSRQQRDHRQGRALAVRGEALDAFADGVQPMAQRPCEAISAPMLLPPIRSMGMPASPSACSAQVRETARAAAAQRTTPTA
jgi:hypothetical protein